MYLLVESAKACGLEPHAYLQALFERYPAATTVEQRRQLLPMFLRIAEALGRGNSVVACRFTARMVQSKLFDSIQHAQETATHWMWIYNNERPNTAMGGIPPQHKLAMAA